MATAYLCWNVLTERWWSHFQHGKDQGQPSDEDCVQVCKHLPGFCRLLAIFQPVKQVVARQFTAETGGSHQHINTVVHVKSE